MCLFAGRRAIWPEIGRRFLAAVKRILAGICGLSGRSPWSGKCRLPQQDVKTGESGLIAQERDGLRSSLFPIAFAVDFDRDEMGVAGLLQCLPHAGKIEVATAEGTPVGFA